MNDPGYLVLLDIDRIQEYIFATNRLKEIRGASLLLEQLNNLECRKLLESFHGEEVFIGGGGILARFSNEANAHAYIANVQALFRHQTLEATITGIVTTIATPQDEQSALRRARIELRLAKGRRGNTQSLLTSAYFRICNSCNTHSVVAQIDGDELCLSCHNKRKATRIDHQNNESAQKGFPVYSGYAKFARRAFEYQHDPDWLELTQTPDKLEQLEGKETSYIGFIHADVNGLGMMLERQHELKAVQELGRKVEEALEMAVVDAAYAVGLKPLQQRWPFLIIIMGGDDVTLIVPAKKAVAFAHYLCLSFQEHVNQLLDAHQSPKENSSEQNHFSPLAMSAGVVIAKPKHPAYVLARLAAELTDSAKRRSYELRERWGAVSSIDFQVVQTPTVRPLDIMRNEEFLRQDGGQEFWYTARPLPCQQLGDEISLQVLLQTIGAMRGSHFPRNKLHAWQELMFAVEDERILGLKQIQSRLTGAAYNAFLQVIYKFGLSRDRLFAQPKGVGTPYVSPLLDLIELYDFAEGV